MSICKLSYNHMKMISLQNVIEKIINDSITLFLFNILKLSCSYFCTCQARIQDFLSEGVQLSENLDKQAKKKKKKKKKKKQKTEGKTEGCGGSSPSADVIDFPDNHLHTSFFR